MNKITIAIDGPAASGKSTTARQVARELNYVYIDTGAMYRAVTLKALQNDVSVNDADTVAALAENIELRIEKDPEKTIIFMDGVNISDAIRTPAIDKSISPVAANRKVREILVAKQQKMGESGAVVLDGRDIGTVVFPNAELKIYMLASVEERARRRMLEQEKKGLKVDIKEIEADIRHRDAQDMGRSHGPLKKAADAVEVDTTGLSIDGQVAVILHLARELIDPA